MQNVSFQAPESYDASSSILFLNSNKTDHVVQNKGLQNISSGCIEVNASCVEAAFSPDHQGATPLVV